VQWYTPVIPALRRWSRRSSSSRPAWANDGDPASKKKKKNQKEKRETRQSAGGEGVKESDRGDEFN
jgi:hypothetical protein